MIVGYGASGDKGERPAHASVAGRLSAIAGGVLVFLYKGLHHLTAIGHAFSDAVLPVLPLQHLHDIACHAPDHDCTQRSSAQHVQETWTRSSERACVLAVSLQAALCLSSLQ